MTTTTIQKRIEQHENKLQQLNNQLQQLNAQRDQTIAVINGTVGAVHELRALQAELKSQEDLALPTPDSAPEPTTE